VTSPCDNMAARHRRVIPTLHRFPPSRLEFCYIDLIPSSKIEVENAVISESPVTMQTRNYWRDNRRDCGGRCDSEVKGFIALDIVILVAPESPRRQTFASLRSQTSEPQKQHIRQAAGFTQDIRTVSLIS
jgi:hypothetical protein